MFRFVCSRTRFTDSYPEMNAINIQIIGYDNSGSSHLLIEIFNLSSVKTHFCIPLSVYKGTYICLDKMKCNVCVCLACHDRDTNDEATK